MFLPGVESLIKSEKLFLETFDIELLKKVPIEACHCGTISICGVKQDFYVTLMLNSKSNLYKILEI